MPRKRKPPKKRGAPRGNLNALKTGASSQQLKTLIYKLQAEPDLLRLMLAFARRPELYDGSLQKAVLKRRAQTERAKERELDRVRHNGGWLPAWDDGEAPWASGNG